MRSLYSEPRERILAWVRPGVSLDLVKSEMTSRHILADVEGTIGDGICNAGKSLGERSTLGAVTVKIVFKAQKVFTK